MNNAIEALDALTRHVTERPVLTARETLALLETIRSALTSKSEPSEIFDWLVTEVTAIDGTYRGSPTYTRDAYWMRDEVVSLIEHARKAFPDRSPDGAGS